MLPMLPMHDQRAIESHSPRGQSRYCEAKGCGALTREGKPFCPEHVESHPYVQSLLAKLERRELEEDRVLNEGRAAVDPSGLTAQELIQALWLHGPRTVERLARELNLSAKTTNGYVMALADAGVLELGTTKRGSTTVSLVGQASRRRGKRSSEKQPAEPGVPPGQSAA